MVDFGAIESARTLIQNRLLPPWRLVEKTTYRSDDSTQGGKSQWKMGFILATTSKGFIDMPHTFNYSHLPLRLLPGASYGETPAPNTVRSLAEVERKALLYALEVSANNVSKAAQSLEINRTTLLPEIEEVRPAHQALNRSAEDDSQESGAHRRFFCCKMRLLSYLS